MKFHISTTRYHWNLVVFVCVEPRDFDEVIAALRDLDASEEILERVWSNLERGNKNEGFTYSAPLKKSSVMMISETTSAAETMNTIVHEIRHLTDDIAQCYHIALTGEEVAYLAGETAKKIFEQCHFLFCDHCRR